MKPEKVVFLSIMICYIGFGVINPILAPLIRDVGLEEQHAGWIVSASALVMLLTSPLWGIWSDKLGRKPVMVIGLIGFALSMSIFAALVLVGLRGGINLTLLFILFIASRVLFGLFSPAVISSSQALIADLTPPDKRSSGMALIGAATGIGFLIGPAMGAGLSTIHLVVPIIISAGLSFTVIFLVIYRIPRIAPKQNERHASVSLSRPGMRPYLVVATCLMSTIVMLQVTSGFFIQDKFGFDGKTTALWVGIGLFSTGFMMALVQMTILRKRSLAPRTLLRVGLPIIAVAFLALILAEHISIIIVAFLLFGIGGGFSLPGYKSGVSLSAGEQSQGAAAGLTATAAGIGSLIAPIGGTTLYRLQAELPFWIGLSIIVLLSIYVWSGHVGLNIQVQRDKSGTSKLTA
ncbi:MFS transporter [Paenibacillus sp. L3-i20]|uniref:MFS transporter n=1 Tax=Paenibacillus sp. L3-i20 TaxID=2905833 RepID=UPI001EDD808E|nr:MFS transporter [Paenibacillus sp. L3-i20]GKU78098.1 MFS transporter [Paenibacillus sp. L3-i20]